MTVIRKIHQLGAYVPCDEDTAHHPESMRDWATRYADAVCAEKHAVRGPIRMIGKVGSPLDPYNAHTTVGFKCNFVVRPPKAMREKVESLLAKPIPSRSFRRILGVE